MKVCLCLLCFFFSHRCLFTAALRYCPSQVLIRISLPTFDNGGLAYSARSSSSASFSDFVAVAPLIPWLGVFHLQNRPVLGLGQAEPVFAMMEKGGELGGWALVI